ncbi:hypothetical protein ACNFJ7_00410 [Sphingomonas sp. HT-1]|uniref:hypothetical protein n=1 Tax=unclassified Sphingomonas TaxID=196159 RepID=UPI0002F187FB|nr:MULTISPECIES: hypothetical protein [unclassified Sphingomonas]KTF67571.1 hypothetical protein ATB93_02245 [Sphingomonas sp. WG]
MTRFTLALVASLFAAAPAFAGDNADSRSFTRDGVTYVYTSTAKGDMQILEGVAKPANQRFRLVVRNGWVDGNAAGNHVSFRVPKAEKVQVAQR